MSLARMQGKSQQSLVVCSMPYNLQSRRIECSGSILKSRLSLLYRNTYVVVCRLGAWSTQSSESAGESGVCGVWSLESLSQRNFLEAGLCCAGIIFFFKKLRHSAFIYREFAIYRVLAIYRAKVPGISRVH